MQSQKSENHDQVSLRSRSSLEGSLRGRGGRGGQRGRGGSQSERGKDSTKGRGGRGGRGGFGKSGGLMQAEHLETSKVSSGVYLAYAKAVRISVAVTIVLTNVLTQVFSVGTNFWLAEWSDDPNSSEPTQRNTYLGVYGALGGASALTIMASSLFVTIGGLHASSKLHNKMLDSILHAPMSFFDTNPKGINFQTLMVNSWPESLLKTPQMGLNRA